MKSPCTYAGEFWFGLGNPALRQPLRRSSVGVKVIVGEGESLAAALKRLRRRVENLKPRYPLQRTGYYVKPSDKRRRKRYRGIVKNRQANSLKRQDEPSY